MEAGRHATPRIAARQESTGGERRDQVQGRNSVDYARDCLRVACDEVVAMQSFVRILAVATLALLLPRTSAASEMEITVREPMILAFGPAGAVFTLGTFDEILIDGVFQETPWFSGFSGSVGFEAGPMSLLTLDDSDPNRVSSHYEFGPGTFTLTANWTDPFGAPLQGKYMAPLLALVVDIRCEQELSALDCGDVNGGSLGDAFVSVGPGLFDPALAQALGLARPGGAFDFDLALDGIDGNPADALRLAGSAGGQEELAIPVTVPEPSVVSLLLLSSFVARRFRFRR